MHFNLDELPASARYELLLSTVVPRPIALITTLSPSGNTNAAPYSLFNVMGHDPAIVAVGILPHAEGHLKDSARNILASSEFVVNLVSEALAEAMNVTCIDAPPGIDELKLAKLDTLPSIEVSPPRISASPVALECRLVTSLSFGPNQALVIGRVVHAYLADACILDRQRCLIDTPALNLIGGMHGARWYTKTSDRFAMDRPTWAQWVNDGKV